MENVDAAGGPPCTFESCIDILQVHVIKFVRESLEIQPVTDEGRQQLMMYTDYFSQWPEEKRVEEYAMLHFAWSLGRENRQQAVLDRVEKVLAV